MCGAAPAAAQEPAATPEPVSAKLSLDFERVSRDGRTTVALRGDSVRVVGTLSAYVPGQRARVRILAGKRKVFVKSVKVKRAGSKGRFTLNYRAKRTGSLRVIAVHRATPALATARAKVRRLRVLTPSAGAGARGPVVRLLQKGLARLRYVVPRSGVMDAGTGRAVMAWRKVNGRARSFRADEPLIRSVLAGKGAFKPRNRGADRHAEADISRQVMALIGPGGKVERTYHISSGAPSTPTVIGTFRVYLKTPGTNAIGMVHSSFFIRGYAVHGYVSVPAFNASHGCLRVPIPNAASIYAWLKHGTKIIVYP